MIKCIFKNIKINKMTDKVNEEIRTRNFSREITKTFLIYLHLKRLF